MEDYVSFEQAQRLKQLGFDWKVNKGYSHFPGEKIKSCNFQQEDVNTIYSKWCFSAPSLAQAQKWLRDVKGIALNITAHDGGFYQWEKIYLPKAPEYEGDITPDIKQYATYEKALSAGIDRTLELLTDQTEKQ